MRNVRKPLTYIIIGLIAIGIIGSLMDNISGMIVPIVVFGAVYLLYKYPPKRYRKTNTSRFTSSRSSASASAAARKEKERVVRKASFRVIKGEKGNEDEPPRYH